MSKHTKRQVNELCFPTCVLLPCLSPQFAFNFLLSYDGQRKRVSSLFLCLSSFSSRNQEKKNLHVIHGVETIEKIIKIMNGWLRITCFLLNSPESVFGKSRSTLSNEEITVLVSREIIRAVLRWTKKLLTPLFNRPLMDWSMWCKSN